MWEGGCQEGGCQGGGYQGGGCQGGGGQVQEIPLTNIYWGVVHTKT